MAMGLGQLSPGFQAVVATPTGSSAQSPAMTVTFVAVPPGIRQLPGSGPGGEAKRDSEVGVFGGVHNMYIYTYIHTYIYIHLYMYVWVNVYIYIYTYTYTCMAFLKD